MKRQTQKAVVRKIWTSRGAICALTSWGLFCTCESGEEDVADDTFVDDTRRADGNRADSADQTESPWPNDVVVIVGDTNRDGSITPADLANRSDWSWSRGGALFLANLDDDNEDGAADASDAAVNSGGDAQDIALFEIRIPSATATSNYTVTTSATSGGSAVRLHERTFGVGNGWRTVPSSGKLEQNGCLIRIGIEAKTLAGIDGWDGYVTLQARVWHPSGTELGSNSVRARVAPWLMLPNSAKTTDLYIAKDRYAEAYKMADDLKNIESIRVHEYSTSRWQEMWMQDTMEIGYAEMPGSRMFLAWRNNRCGEDGWCDRFAPTLRSKNIGVFDVPTSGATGMGSWDDWFGNLEVSPATSTAPLGRVYYGVNLSRSFKDFIEAQELQLPIELDPTWLLIKHVDEFVNFVPGPDGQPRMIVTSPRRANEVLMDDYYGPYNRSIQAKIDTDVAKMKTALGISDEQIVLLPQYYSAGGIADWSSAVNSVHLNGVMAVGNTNADGPQNSLASTPQGRDIEAAFRGIGLEVSWVNDIAYQPNHGNVHCGTNTLRVPDFDRYWSRLDHWDQPAGDR